MILKILLFVLFLIFSGHSWADWPHFVPVEKMESGIGKWHELPFGRARILSCTTGVKNLSMVVGGLQVKLKPNWTMKKPTLIPLKEDMPVWIETPLRPGSGKNTVYQKEVFFPFVYPRQVTDTNDYELGVQGNFPVCQEKLCMNLPIRVSLTLPSDEADYTTACAYILNQQKQVPLLADAEHIKGFAWQNQDEVVMLFSGIKKPGVALLQTPNQDDFVVEETLLDKTGVMMYVKTKPWAVGQKKEWILITNKGAFRVPVLMRNHSVSLPDDKTSNSIWWMGWELFFLTPLFIWWGLGLKKTKKLWQQEILKFWYIFPFVFCIRLILEQYIDLSCLIYTVALLGLVCLFPPQKKGVTLALFLIWPYFPKLPEMSLGLWFGWIIVMLMEMGLPFVFLYYKSSEIGKILRNLKKRSFFVYNLIFLIPTLMILILGIWGMFQNKVSYQNEINKNGFTIVVNEKEASLWQKVPNVSFINPHSILGQSLVKIYKQKTPFILWQDEWGRVIFSSDSSLADLSEFMSNWKNYHARYMP